jgi:alginate O-acetyltransferase complex protein AlgI
VVFSSIPFLFYFLPLVLAGYYLAPVSWRNALLLISGLIFYVWGAGSFVLILLLSIGCNWAFALLADRANQARHPQARTWVLVLAVIFNLVLLGYFKYINFIIGQYNLVGGWLSDRFTPLSIPGIILPIGISFITFQAISYVADVANGRERPLRNPVDYGMYIAMFPHSIAGPIVRFHQLAAQIPAAVRVFNWDNFFSGLVRFAHGLVKKVVIADSVSRLVDPAFAASGSLTPAAAWVGVLGFTIQVYFDFSGYSDMAIGLARLFGFNFPENFNRPLSSVSITDFWRRWHITLSAWFRDYVFFPLGGSRTTPGKVYRNLFIVFLLVGVWHGANWTFVVFGVLQGTLMCFERMAGKRFEEDFRHPVLRRIINLVVLLLCLVLFRAQDVSHAWTYYQSMFGVAGGLTENFWAGIPRESLVALVLGSLTLLLPGHFTFGRYLDESRSVLSGWARLGVAGVGMAAAVTLVLSRNFISFIYFKF